MKKKPDTNKEIAQALGLHQDQNSKLSEYELIMEKNIAWQF